MQIGKVKVITDLMDQQKMLIMALQEMRHANQDHFETQGYRIYKEMPGKRAINNVPQFGTGFVIYLKTINSILDLKSQSSRT